MPRGVPRAIKQNGADSGLWITAMRLIRPPGRQFERIRVLSESEVEEALCFDLRWTALG